MEIWIPITIVAAFFQNLRSIFQKQLKSRLTTAGATFSRFIFAVPVAMLVLSFISFGLDQPVPPPNIGFLGYGIIAAFAQIIATFLLVYLFGLRNFAVGTTFSKTAAVQAAFLGFLVLGDRVSIWALLGIFISLVGVIMISAPKNVGSSIFNRAALVGMASGLMFGISAVGYRAASLALPSGDFFVRGATLLAYATAFQTIVMLIYLHIAERGQISLVFANWRLAVPAGIVGAIASLGWFTAMTLQNAAYVKALAQVELVFTLLAAWFIFKEKISKRELFGIGLVVSGILILVLLR